MVVKWPSISYAEGQAIFRIAASFLPNAGNTVCPAYLLAYLLWLKKEFIAIR